MKRLFYTTVVLLVVAVLMQPGVAAAAEKIKVVATFSVIADMVTNVAGDLVDLVTIVGPDGDCEEYEPTAADVPKMANARILFMNGLNDDFEPWLPNLVAQAKFAGTKVIVSRGVKGLSAEDEHPQGGKPKAVVLDQHAWMNPHNGIIYAKNIADTLARIDPANADTYHTRAASYTQQLREVDSWAHAEMAAVPTAKRRVLSSHDLGQRLDQQIGAVSRGSRASDRPDPARTCKGFVPGQHHRSTGHGTHQQGDRRCDRRHDIWRRAVEARRRGRHLHRDDPPRHLNAQGRHAGELNRAEAVGDRTR
jgi:ABC-type Zn2+ transport system substrate-binding protein/surface adhesin